MVIGFRVIEELFELLLRLLRLGSGACVVVAETSVLEDETRRDEDAHPSKVQQERLSRAVCLPHTPRLANPAMNR